MDALTAMSLVWGVITVAFVALLLYRWTLTRNESDWIPLSNNSVQDSAIQSQTIAEVKKRKLTIPIRALGTLSVVLLLVLVGFWLFHTIVTPPAMPQ